MRKRFFHLDNGKVLIHPVELFVEADNRSFTGHFDQLVGSSADGLGLKFPAVNHARGNHTQCAPMTVLAVVLPIIVAPPSLRRIIC